MGISVFDIFKIGIGPSSSHTVGPMMAAKLFAEDVVKIDGPLPHNLSLELYGSLGLTGKGHGTDKALLLGLEGKSPETVDVDEIPRVVDRIGTAGEIKLMGQLAVPFDVKGDMQFWAKKSLPHHANGMLFKAFDQNQNLLLESEYYSVGGGFIASKEQFERTQLKPVPNCPYPFDSGADLLQKCKDTGFSVSRLVMENEKAWRSEAEVRSELLKLWREMNLCIQRGCQNEGVLPGFLKVKRRAPEMCRKLKSSSADPLGLMDWVNLYALAVNEENAAAGRVVTSPTNGAAGVLPAVLKYVMEFQPNPDDEKVISFLLTAAAIAILYKKNSSISGAEVGCQGEVGVACSMAAGALTEVMGGTPLQVENAAEIGMEHNLGLTCDPVGGFVQVPCIERNAMAAIKSINAARLAMRGDGQHAVTLDKVILTMKQTGEDMKDKYKETSRGGLAVNIVEC